MCVCVVRIKHHHMCDTFIHPPVCVIRLVKRNTTFKQQICSVNHSSRVSASLRNKNQTENGENFCLMMTPSTLTSAHVDGGHFSTQPIKSCRRHVSMYHGHTGTDSSQTLWIKHLFSDRCLPFTHIHFVGVAFRPRRHLITSPANQTLRGRVKLKDQSQSRDVNVYDVCLCSSKDYNR